MPLKNGRGKTKGDKKKKEEKVLPVVIDITVKLPDETHVILKGISTDRIVDVRRLLSVNTNTCCITKFSLTHEVRGPRLQDSVDVAALKPCVLTLVEEDYDEESATAHVRRVLDIVACTSSVGPSAIKDSGKNARGAQDNKAAKKSGKSQSPSPPQSPKDAAVEGEGEGEGELSNSCPKFGSFYEFFSLSHLTPPLQFIRRSTRQHADGSLVDDHLFSLEVKLCNGKLVLIEACRKGFYCVGKQRILCHNLIDLLRQLSRAFDNAYNDLMTAFSERNKFGNLPYGYRANTWLIPPVAAQSLPIFHPLPVEDETWGGNGGGLGRDGKSDLLPWTNEFLSLSSMPCKTAEERQIRDRKAFLLHSLFVDVAIFRAISAVWHVMGNSESTHSAVSSEIIYAEKVGDLSITVMKDSSNASCKVDTKIDGVQVIESDPKKLLERNLLKGVTADENTAAQDIATLGVVNVRYCGYIAVVKVEGRESVKTGPPLQIPELIDQPEGGANALNINSLRLLLPKREASELVKALPHSRTLESEERHSSQAFVERLLEKSLAKVQEEEIEGDIFVRWELGACWIQHLLDQKNTEKDKKQSTEKPKKETKVEGLGTPLRSLNNKKNSENLKSTLGVVNGEAENAMSPSLQSQLETNANENELALRKLLSDAAFTRLKESETGLHCKSMQELIDLSQKYYNEVALPKLVADFGSLELSPVDGRTLTDFMHTRGLRMCSLGQVVKLSEKLSHVQSLCIHEMIVRAFKHVLRAVIAAVVNTEEMAGAIAAALNLMLGVPENGQLNQSFSVHFLVWRWLEVFLKKRYEWDLINLNYKDVRKTAILRGLCHKVGIELVPRDYDMNSPEPFQKVDIVSLVPASLCTKKKKKKKMAHGGYGKRRVAGRKPKPVSNSRRSSKGLGVDKKAKPKPKPKSVSLKNQIRSIQRMLRKDLSSEVREAQEKKLEGIKKQQEIHNRLAVERKIFLRERKIKFFERRKIERRIRRLEKMQRASSGQSKEAEIAEQLSKLKEDLEYVRFFPKTEKYVSLFMGGDDTDIVDRRNRLRKQIKANIIAAAASGKDLEETGSEDDGLLDLSEDDFFLTGSSSDEADADDEWTDKSTKEQASSASGKAASGMSSDERNQRHISARALMPPPRSSTNSFSNSVHVKSRFGGSSSKKQPLRRAEMSTSSNTSNSMSESSYRNRGSSDSRTGQSSNLSSNSDAHKPRRKRRPKKKKQQA